ncbi:aspartyl/asparaginyl beta-hydroxylase domain-containing protein [Streptomyces sp. PCS3-D2]|uniref:aspartyl/asparaginyl beta-hydroxylase domain-containing protein n=1 Tax=Streptomyces sp. PCS3-D2 TaxID=1460244 RepID=UPI0004482871|nr:aspartyl/asparaginyl beta-hydroxylase domain-containing protein [Streptomyces sp. PCS3-D2]WKV71380.1 aspartyl/asparaginyl beta-hydroxylase domain-containing protein [Streptomyces sp. PCS3-D2]
MPNVRVRVGQFATRRIWKSITWLERRMAATSPVGDKPFFPDDTFPWAKVLEENWRDIRRELDELLVHRDELPNFQDISLAQRSLTQDDQWKTYFFAGYGIDFETNRERCPRTIELLKNVDGLSTAFFSILGPGKRLHEHRGPYKGVLRYHLALKIPDPQDACGIRVGGETAHWEEGRSMVFDDTFPHEAWNETDEDRVVLFMDIVRPLKFPYAILNRLALKYIASTPFVRDAKDKHSAWEKQFETMRQDKGRAGAR